jgi:glycosyltransferase involved in cell wall biosynthesis
MNYGHFTEEAIDSVLAQDFPAEQVEIIVVDDGSTDDTGERVKKYGSRIRYFYKANGGQAAALNSGFANARGEIVALLDKVVLFVADWAAEKRKGLSLLFDALRKLAHINDLCLVMLGRKAADLQPDARCIQLEFIEDEEAMSYLYSAADIFVIPSVQDNFPNTALEALACGVPTVAFHVGGVPEIVANGCTGVTVRPGDSEALARAIEDLLADPGQRASLSRESRRVALEEFSLEIQARFYLELYESLVF